MYQIDYQKLKDLGYKGIIWDIDQTLVTHGYPPTPKTDELLQLTHNLGLTSIVVSNNSEERIQSFLKNLSVPYVHAAEKPSPKGLEKALKIMGLPKSQTVVIGDQVFTDILAANRAGICSILVENLLTGSETKLGIRRQTESFILKIHALIPKQPHALNGIKRK